MVVENATWLRHALQQDPNVASRLVIPTTLVAGRPGSFFPSGIMNHHTACMANAGHDPQSCLNVVRAGNSVAPGPICHLLVTNNPVRTKFNPGSPDPRVYLVSEGRCNHAGNSALPWNGLPGNGSSIAIEVCGPPEHWPYETVALLERINAAILRNRRWGVHQVTTHWESAIPRGRKIDLSGSWYAQSSLGRLEPWSPGMFRLAVDTRLNQEEIAMRTINPYRAYDSRPTEQHRVHPDLQGKTPLGQLHAGQQREVTVGMTSEATIQLTGIRHTGAGYLAVNSPGGNVSAINLDANDPVETIVLPALTPGGKVTISAHGPGLVADFVVDVRQVAP